MMVTDKASVMAAIEGQSLEGDGGPLLLLLWVGRSSNTSLVVSLPLPIEGKKGEPGECRHCSLVY